MPRYFKKLLFFTLLIVVATTGILIARAVNNRGADPVLWLKFDEGQGAVAYDASSTNDATITGATWASEDDCRIGKCLYFDGADDYAQVLDAASLDVGLNDFSISAWVKANQAGDIVTKGTIGNFKLNFSGSNKFWATVTEEEAGINQPSGVATDGTYLYIADTNNNRIVKRLASNFTYVTEIGSLGTGNDQFSYPYGIATDGTYIYVVDTGNTRIVKRLASDLSYVAQIGSSGSGDDQFSVPNGIATDGTYIYIADTFNNRIVKRLASDLSYVSKIGSFGSGNDQFNSPNGIATDGTYIYIADTSNYRIVKRLATDALTYVSKIGSNGSGDDQFNLSASIAVYGAYIYVADTSNNRIVKRMASDALTYVSKIGSSGSGNDQFYSPYGIATDGTYIYVADTSNNRIVKRLASDLSYVSQIGSSGSGNDQFKQPYGIVVYGTNIYVADSGNHRIVKRLASDLSYVAKIGSAGSGNDQFSNPAGIATDGTNVYVADTGNNRIVKRLASNLSYVSQIGSLGTGNDQFNAPNGIATDGTYVYVADSGNHRIVKRLASDLSYVDEIGKNVSSLYSTRTLSKNTWYYVVLNGSHGASSFTLATYINGVLDSSVETAGRVLDNSSNLRIGGGTTAYFKGLIDDVRVFNYARSVNQIKADYVAKSSERGSPIRSVSVGESRDAGEGLVGYWKMDESSWASGTAAIIDSSGNANTGTAYAGVDTTGTAKFGLAGSFDGTNDYGEITSAAGSTLDITGNATVSAWVYPTMLSSDANSKRILEKAADGLSFTYIASTARIGFGDTNGYMYATKDIRSGWHHVAAVKSGTTTTGIKIYVDGVDQGTLTQSGTWNGWTTSANPFRIGARNTILASTYWQGIIDDVKIYNTARDANQIRRDYESGPPPVAHWKMDEKTGDTAYDTAGTNNGDLAGACPGAATCPIWTQGKYGSALKFDGVNDYVSVANSLSNVRTVDFWVNNGNANDGLLELINNDTYISIASSAISATNFSSASTYVDGVAGVTAISSGWHHVAVTTATGITASSIVIGEANSDFSAGSIDDVRVYNYARTPKQILEDMSARGGSAFGGNAGGAVGYWDFNEAQGLTAYDRSSNDNDLTLSTASWTTAGKYGAAFAGVTNRRLTKTDDPDFDFAAADDFSISTWFKRDTVSNAEYLIYKQNGFEGYTIYMDASGDIIFGIGDVNSTAFPEESIGNIAKDYDNNAWHHAVGVKTSNSRIDLYVDGVLIASDTSLTTDASLENAGKLIIADSDEADGTDEFLGTIDEVKIYRAALSPADIKLEYNHGASLRLGSIGTESDGITPSNSAASAYCVPGDTTACAAPVGHWKMDDRTGQYANDISGNGNTGTWAGGGTATWMSAAACRNGSCLSFVNNWVQVTQNSSINMTGKSAYTISVWAMARSDGENNTGEIIDKGANTYLRVDNESGDYLDLEGKIALTIMDANLNISSAIQKNTWNHIVMVYEDDADDEISVYINGVLKGTSILGNGSLASGDSNSLNIGGDSSNNFDGLIDDVRIYNYARTPAQIAWDYNRGAPVAQWKMDEGQDTATTCNATTLSVYDAIGSNDGTLSLTPAGNTDPATARAA